ncbi:DUF3515 family protein [Agromyces sp. LHK192]|uniref:DUF3515 family protein n=1 Tax=Agromyces sp. LHK192 TaxID=2498704 RepID=UPI000FD71B7D|nr:DUF3515 family protein [Agromyces sp. LHK192]
MPPRPRTSRRTRRSARAYAILLPAVAATVALAGCASTVSLEHAEDAAAVECADVVVRLPDVVAEQAERQTDAQGTGAWGDPAAVLLRCGVPTPGPTEDRCVTVDGVDWVIDESDAPRYRFTTYGRTPAVEVVVDNEIVSGTTAITDLANAVSVIPADGACTTVTDPADVTP